MNLNHPFTCKNLLAVLPYEVCLRRQSAMLKEGSRCQHPRFPTCHYCEEGKKIRAKFPDWKYVKNNKRKKPDRVYLYKKSGSRAACLKAIDLKPDKRADVEASSSKLIAAHDEAVKWAQELKNPIQERPQHAPLKPFNVKLFKEAQMEYIETLRKQGKKVEARERIKLVKSELTKRGGACDFS